MIRERWLLCVVPVLAACSALAAPETGECWTSLCAFNSSLNLEALTLTEDAAGNPSTKQFSNSNNKEDCMSRVNEFVGHEDDLKYVVGVLSRLKPLLPGVFWGEVKQDDGAGVFRTADQHEVESYRSTVDLVSVVSLPLTCVAAMLRMLVVEDAESLFDSRRYETFVVMDENAGSCDDARPLGLDDRFEVVVRYLGIDNFTEGRLRDSLGGNGGELSLQVSLNGLTDKGLPMAEDLRFLMEEKVKRRLPILTILEGTEKGKATVEALRKQILHVQDRLKAAGDAGDLVARLKSQLGAYVSGQKAEFSAALEALVAELSGKLADEVGPGTELHAVGKAFLDLVSRELLASFDTLKTQAGLDAMVDRLLVGKPATPAAGATPASPAVPPTLDAFRTAMQFVESSLANVVIDDESVLEQVTVIKGLADADRLVTVDYTGIRPRAMRSYSSAASRFPYTRDQALTCRASSCTDKKTCRHALVSQDGLVYRGTLRELSSLGTAAGFSLSTLLLERDSDRIVQALDLVAQYAKEKDLKLGVAGVEIAGSAVAEALGQLAESIADDDVELKSLDLRFMSGELPSGASPGRRVFALRPCSVVVTRNYEGSEWDAVAIVEIKKLP